METFGKAWRGRRGGSATVTRVGRLALLLGAGALLAGGGAGAALLAAGPGSAVASPGTSTTATTTTPAVTNVSTSPSVVAFTGHGWGHGLGLGQWGAYGYAQHGWTYQRILTHYYPGTTLGAAPRSSVRILVAAQKTVTIGSTAPWSVRDAAGTTMPLEVGTVTLGPALTLDGTALQPPLRFAAKQPLTVGGRAYRGTLGIVLDGKQLDVVDTVGLEQYVKGVVPAEMPSAWAPAALQAQAVAARSYALANLAHGRPFDLYGDTRSQVYAGVAAEAASTDAAVDATKGQVVLYKGKVADTLFFSTSGGRTASALESTGIDVPYLIPVVDPYDSLSPYHDWGPVLVDGAEAAKQLKLSGPIVDLAVTDGASGRVKNVVATAADESHVTLTGNQVRGALGLRSTWFQPALLQLLPVSRSITYGGAISLRGVLRGADGVSLEARPAGLGWSDAGSLEPASDGTFSTIVRPQVNTWYRLAWGAARAGLAKVTVTARVSAVVGTTGVTGTLRPVAPGAPVELQRKRDDGTWEKVSATTADAASAWSFAGAPQPGTYRVRGVPGHGVAAGFSAPFTVQ
jgi:stage II sporulation protein D